MIIENVEIVIPKLIVPSLDNQLRFNLTVTIIEIVEAIFAFKSVADELFVKKIVLTWNHIIKQSI